MNFLIDFLKNDKTYLDIIYNLNSKNCPIYCTGVIKESLSHLVYSIFENFSDKNFLLLVENENRANEIYYELKNFLEDKVLVYPNFDIRFNNIEILETNIENKRINVMNKLISNEKSIIISTFSALSKKISTPNFFKSNYILIDENSKMDHKNFSEKLVKMHYDRTTFVEAKGQFSIRGSIIDIYPINFENPIRIELFGDEIDSIRFFDINSQRSIENVTKIEIIPAKEMVLSENDIENILIGLKKDIDKLEKSKIFGKNDKITIEKFNKIYNDLKVNFHISNIDLISPYIKKDSFATILDYFDEDSIVLTEDIFKIYNKNLEIENLFLKNLMFFLENGEILNSHKNILVSFEENFSKIKKFNIVNFSQLYKKTKIIDFKVITNFNIKKIDNFNRNFEFLFKNLKIKLQSGYNIVIFSGSLDRANILKKMLYYENINSKICEKLDYEFNSSVVMIFVKNFESGFEYLNEKVLFLTHKEIYGNVKKNYNKSKKNKNKNLLSYTDLNIGDYVVHENHGIGEYRGIKQIEVGGITKDHILILYKSNDKLYIPIDQMNLIQKYIGKDGFKPKLNRLGSNEWGKTKSRVKKALDQIALDLVQLYAKRDKLEGYSFSKDTTWQKEFEDSFIYEETYSQLKAIEEIKSDMESFKPMDRLLCGDVGYGKTEVALRAAFKAMMDDKQVAFLVPTTILAKQHYNTAIQRIGEFPFEVEMLSRFRTQEKQRKIIKDIKIGKINLLIGTHKLLSQKLEFKDLGLLIIDEEQRFGVKHKEHLKKIKENIDVLSLSATPIPRTMQMSLVGIRDMSILDDPPEERLIISTFVLEYDESIIREAIYKEINRGGQVYFVYNRIKDMDIMYLKLLKLLPNIRIAIAHSKLSNKELEKIMYDFQEGEYDVLLCTTIIETGMDIKNCNTMIIYDSDMMGLSQLYQLKGRIGRSNKRAYAYFTYENNKSLTEISEKRLLAIRDFSEFGSGFKIAMRDLELRGAGNILGECQSGHIENIGYEMYVRMLEESIKNVKGEKIVNFKNQTTIEISINAYIPSYYISDVGEKIDMYRKIACMKSKYDFEEIYDELIDRFGDIPNSVLNVMNVSYLKFISSDLGFINILERNKSVIFKLENSSREILTFISKLPDDIFRKIEFNINENTEIIFNYNKDKLKESIDFIERLYHLKNENF